jgi:hypothetical protein
MLKWNDRLTNSSQMTYTALALRLIRLVRAVWWDCIWLAKAYCKMKLKWYDTVSDSVGGDPLTSFRA